MAKEVLSDLHRISAVRDYLNRVDAYPTSLTRATSKEQRGRYWRDLATIKFAREDGTVTVTVSPDSAASIDQFEPTEDEQRDITAAWHQFDLPKPKLISPHGTRGNVPAFIRKAQKEDRLFEFVDPDGWIIMFQVRNTDEDVENNKPKYISYQVYDDDEWRISEPDELPLWGLDQLKDHSVVFLHEGAKAARHCRRLRDRKNFHYADLAKAHPWMRHLDCGAHLGWIGGALSVHRTDWSVLKQAGVQKVIIVSDNDVEGRAAVPKISKKLSIHTMHLQFTGDGWPPSFDLADPFPEEFFSKTSGLYIGPSYTDSLHPATYMTKLIPPKDGKKGRPTAVLRDHAKDAWAYIEKADHYVCMEMPWIIYTGEVLNKVLAPFSDVKNLADLINKSYHGRFLEMTYRPGEDRWIQLEGGESAINTYCGGSIAPAPRTGPEDIQPFFDYLENLFPDREERYVIQKWMATLIARPENRMEFALLLISERQGMGKTTLGQDILAPIIGAHNVSYPSPADLKSQFNYWNGHKRLAIVNEIYEGDSFKVYNTLKDAITDKTITINRKNEKPYKISNCLHIIACSNNERALRIAKDDRRWFIPKVTEQYWGGDHPTHKANYDRFFLWLREGGHRHIINWADEFGDYFHKGEIAPLTGRKAEIIDASKLESEKLAEEIAIFLNEKAADRDGCLYIRDDQVAVPLADIKEILKDRKVSAFDDQRIQKALSTGGMIKYPLKIKVSGRAHMVFCNRALWNSVQELGTDEPAIRELIRQKILRKSDITNAFFPL